MDGPKHTWAPNHTSNALDRWAEHQSRNHSAYAKMQHQYWVTKQTVFRKLGKKEDECIVSSDAELDAKLELFRSVQESCLELQRIIDKYQERLCILAQEENAMGRFLKESGKNDKTRAGKMMTTVGKALSYSGQQRISLRMPLLRLHQEVETFRHRAIEDTLTNVQAMEKVRTAYRASLNWMKDVSQELDPDTFKQLDRFRKVQDHVKHSKALFDQQKLDCLQKVDLLAAARCNMFSHALILYQNALLQFAEKSAHAFTTIANSFQGYQQFEFSVVKELADLCVPTQTESADQDDDKLLEFEEAGEAEEVKEALQQPAVVAGGEEELFNLLSLEEPSMGAVMPSQLLACAQHECAPLQPSKGQTVSGISENRPASNLHTSGKTPWLDLFAELDPLGNPDAVGKTAGEMDRNC